MLPLVMIRRVDGHRPFAVEVAGEQFAADGVAHVVGEEGEGVEVPFGGQGHHHVGLLGDGEGDVGLVGEAVPEQVEQHDATVLGQGREGGPEVERRRREARG